MVDGGGATLMPGLINGHSHIGYSEEGTSLYSLGDTPPEENTLITMQHAQILYDHGFTGPGLRRDGQDPHGHRDPERRQRRSDRGATHPRPPRLS